MNSQFGSLYILAGRNVPLTFGVIVMFFFSMLYCVFSAVFGHFNNSAGILFFGHTVGNISRYYDPFLVGAFAVCFTWGRVPPNRYKGMNEVTSAIAGAGFFLLAFFVVVAGNYGVIFQRIGCAMGYSTALTIIILSPFGMRGAILSTAVSLVALHFEKGPIPAILFVTLVYLGKWINWWIFNIIRHGFKGAKNALKSSGGVGAVAQQS